MPVKGENCVQSELPNHDVDCVCVTDDDERKPYFKPREAKPDHPLIKRRDAPAMVAVNQVMPPDIQNGFDSQAVSIEHFVSGSYLSRSK